MVSEWVRSLGVIIAALVGLLAFLALAAALPVVIVLLLPETLRASVCGTSFFCVVPLGLLAIASCGVAVALLYRYWDELPFGRRRYDGQ